MDTRKNINLCGYFLIMHKAESHIYVQKLIKNDTKAIFST